MSQLESNTFEIPHRDLDASPGATGRDGTSQLENFSVQHAVATQAAGFLTQITQTVVLYVTITGGLWAVVSSNTIGFGSVTLRWILALHIALSLGVALGLWGMGNNFIQRLNLAGLLGQRYWPDIQALGDAAWDGPPNRKGMSWMPTVLRPADNWLRYKASRWPSLRHQRLWFVVPILAAVVSAGLLVAVWPDRQKRNRLCAEAFVALESAQRDSMAFDRAKYIFDKAGCRITTLHGLFK